MSDPPDALPTSEALRDAERGFLRPRPSELIGKQHECSCDACMEWRHAQMGRLLNLQHTATVAALASGGDAAIRDAVDWFGAAHLPDAPLGEIERCRNVLLGVIAAQRAAEAARVRIAALEEAAKVVQRLLAANRATGDLCVSPTVFAADIAQAIRALREAPRG